MLSLSIASIVDDLAQQTILLFFFSLFLKRVPAKSSHSGLTLALLLLCVFQYMNIFLAYVYWHMARVQSLRCLLHFFSLPPN
jgi:hypothetical protein